MVYLPIKWSSWLALSLLAWLSLSFAHAQDVPLAPREIVVTLYFAQNGAARDELGDNLKLRDNLVKLFGYQTYQKIGTAMVYPHSFSPVTAWPNKLFSLTVQAVNPASPRYDFELSQEEKPVLKGSFIPKPNTPIIIKGPLYDQGLLILVVNAVKL